MCIRIDGLESSRSGCQLMAIVTDRGLESAGMMIWTRLCDIGWNRLHNRRSESFGETYALQWDKIGKNKHMLGYG